MTVDFSKLSPPKLLEELSFEAILAQRKAQFLSYYSGEARAEMEKTLARESDPIVKLLEEASYRELVLRQQRNDDVKSLLVMYATGTDLDHLVADRGLQRLLIVPADLEANPPIEAVYESDDDLRQRYLLAMNALSVAGPKAAYAYHALSADGRVGDVSVHSPTDTPYLLDIYILQNDSENGQASQELIDIVQTALDDETVRPCCDRPTVRSVIAVDYQITAKIFVAQTAQNSILLDQAIANLRRYVNDQRRIGRSIRLSAIYAQLHISGVEHVEISQPAEDIILDYAHAGNCTAINVTLGGASG